MRLRSKPKKSMVKWKKFLFLLTVGLLAAFFIRSTFFTRRAKASLIYNNEHLCSSNEPLNNSSNQKSIVIVVSSRRDKFMQRNLIRRTYGSIKHFNNVHILAVVFMLGGLNSPDEMIPDIAELEVERIQFGDLVMGDFIDTFKNRTNTVIMAYDWLVSFCHEADIVVKIDDDVMLNIFKLTEELDKWSTSAFQSLAFSCVVHWNEEIIRDEKNGYYVSPKEYPYDRAPTHCAGLGYVTPMVTVQRIADEISRSFLGVVCRQDDVFMTGIVPEKINLADGKDHIEFFDKRYDWLSHIAESSVDEDSQHAWKLLTQDSNSSIDFDEFRKRSGKRVFYLIEYGPKFEGTYQRLWYLMKRAYEK